MKRIMQAKNKVTFLLLFAILVLCIGFIFVACGVGPVTKGVNNDRGNFALDTTDCPGGRTSCTANATATDTAYSMNSIQGKPLTLEAWIKPKVTSSVYILRHIQSRGAALKVAGIGGNTTQVTPMFEIRRVVFAIGGAGATSSVPYTVSGSVIDLDAWTHIAGILTNDDHSGVHTTCAGVGANVAAEDDLWHMDIYENGVYDDCSYTWGGNTPMTIACDAAGVFTFSSAHGLSVGEQMTPTTSIANCNITAGTAYEVCTVPTTTTVTLDDTVGCGSPLTTTTNAAVAMIDPTAAADAFAHAPGAKQVNIQAQGIVDETRIWTTDDRTILDCMNQELGTSGTCDRTDSNLLSYLRFNAGAGHSVMDEAGIFAGAGLVYILAPDNFPSWDTGWTSDTPF